MGFTKINTTKYIYLQSKKATSIQTNGAGRDNIYNFNITSSPIDLKDYGKISVASISTKNAGANDIYTFRLQSIVCKDIYDTDFGPPIIYSGVLNPYQPPIKHMDISIPSQSIGLITVVVSDATDDFYNGVPANFEFVLCLEINEYDPPKVNYNDGIINKSQNLISRYN